MPNNDRIVFAFVELIQRRYAVSSSSLPRPAPIKDCVPSGFIGIEISSEPCGDNTSTINTSSNVKDVVNVNAKDELLVPLRIAKLPSESEDEAVNETTTLLDNPGSELLTGKSSAICHHEMVALNIANCNDIDPVDVADDDTCFKLPDKQEDADVRIDTSL